MKIRFIVKKGGKVLKTKKAGEAVPAKRAVRAS